MKKILFLLLLLPSISFGATTNITCDDVISQLSGNHSKYYEILDSNGVRSSYGTDLNEWKIRIGVPGLSNQGMCLYNWKLVKPDFSISTEWGTNVSDKLQYIILEKDGISIYYAERHYTPSLLQEDSELLKAQLKAKDNTLQNVNQDSNVSATEQSKKKELDDFNKSIEDAKKIIEQKQSSIVSIEQKQSLVTNELKVSKKLSPTNERKAILLKKRIQLLKKQLDLLEKQLSALN